jgi:predicted nucleic acid-binding protein
MILDSSYVFDLIGGDPSAHRMGEELTDTSTIQWLPVPVLAEVYYGVTYASGETERREVQNALLGYPRVEIDEEIARTASSLLASADQESGGVGNSGVETNDAYIGAIADVIDEPVLTANPGDFERLGVPVETY